MAINSYPLPSDFAGERIDLVLSRFTGISRAKCVDLLATGKVLLDGVPITKNSFRLPAGGVLEVDIPTPPSLEPMLTPVPELEILYEDDDLVVIAKPAGVAAHPSLNFTGPDVLGALLERGIRLTTSGPIERKGIVHRLDVGTSGCMVVAKSEMAYTVLKRAFKERTVTKVYHALVQGHPDPLSGTIEAPIARDFRHQWKMGIAQDGKYAITHYDTLEAMAGATLLQVHLETGRTHQIRVHVSALKHPCVGDEMYGADVKLAQALELDRQWLHAVRLGFIHPRTQEYVEFYSSYSADLQRSLDLMRAGIIA